MSIDFKIENDDIIRKDGKTLLTNEKNELIQNVKNRLLTRQGEFFLDTTYGLDYNGVFPMQNKIMDDELKELTIRDCVSQDDRIISVESIGVKHNKKEREDNITFNAKTIYGNIQGGVEIG